MKLNQTNNYLLVALLGIAAVILIAAGSLQPLQAQTPSATPTRISLVGQGTVTPLFAGHTPTPTLLPGVSVPPTWEPPATSVHTGPTITPSGPMVALDMSKPEVGVGWRVNNAMVARLYAALPKTIASYRVLTIVRDTFYDEFVFALENPQRSNIEHAPY